MDSGSFVHTIRCDVCKKERTEDGSCLYGRVMLKNLILQGWAPLLNTWTGPTPILDAHICIDCRVRYATRITVYTEPFLAVVINKEWEGVPFKDWATQTVVKEI